MRSTWGVEEEHQQGREQGRHEVPEVGEGRRRHGTDDQVAEQPAAEGGDLGEDGDAEDVEVLADGQQRAGDGEDEDADQVERVLNRRAEELVHPNILTQERAPRLTKQGGGLG
ncbi:hypothetical protein GCM10020256_21630 [Streptomyces thermocoprophilus]